MQQTLLTAGLACVIAAIVGGGLEAFGVKIPLLNSAIRKTALAVLGISLLLLAAYPFYLKEAVISGKIFDIGSGQPISGVRLSLIDTDGQVLEQDFFTTAQDGGFQFTLPSDIKNNQLPLHFQLNRKHWAASYVPDEKIALVSVDRQINLPVDLAGLSVSAVDAANSSHPPMISAESSRLTNEHPGSKTVQSTITLLRVDGKLLLNTGTARLVVRDVADHIDFEVRVHTNNSPSLRFDVNKNDILDANVDVQYGLTRDNVLCTQYLLTLRGASGCGGFHSNSTVDISRGLDAGVAVKIVIWHIPKREINAEDGNAHFIAQVYNEITNGWSYFPGQDFSQTFHTQ